VRTYPQIARGEPLKTPRKSRIRSDIRMARARPASRTREDTTRCPRDPHGAAQGVREMDEPLQPPDPGSIEDARADAAAAQAGLAELAAEVGFTPEEQEILVIEFGAAISKEEPSLFDDGIYGKSIHICRFQAALSECSLSLVASADVQGIAKKIDWAVTLYHARTQLEPISSAKSEDKIAREIRSHAIKLARLLSKTSGTLAASLERSFDREKFSGYGLISPFELQPMLREIGRGATQHVRRPRASLPAVPKVKGRSPMQLFIRELAPQFKALFGKPANVTRINALDKGGAFPDFVGAVARQWKIKPPSVEAVVQALRNT
jgi:hypothetical protein